MGFNRNDLQGDDDFNFDDDDFKFDDQPSGGDDFKFDDDSPDIDLDNGTDSGFGFESEDMPELNEEGSAPARTNRTFIYIAALMIILFLLGLGAVLFLATQNQGPSPIDQTRSAIETQNADTQILLLQTGTAAAQFILDQTQTALVPTNTPTPTETPTREPTITPTIEATLDATQQAANALLTQVADQATQTAIAAQAALITPTVAAPSGDAVSLTATALAAILGGGGGGITDADLTSTALAAGLGNNVPTQEVGIVPTRLPDTGFFDDVSSGSNVGMIALLALVLVGVIGVSRVVRAANK